MRSVVYSLVVACSIILFTDCNRRTVERVDPDETIDLSGRWNDTDSRLVAEEMVKDALGRPWLVNFTTENAGKPPRMIVGTVYNKSHEHITSETFVKDLERELLNSGRVKLAQSKEMRDELREERDDQNNFSSKETAKKWGKELAADFMLQGTINSIVDSYKKEKVVSYQIDLELTDLETNETVWIGQKKIKKYIEN